MSSSLTERRRKEIASLAHKKYRVRLGEMLLEGVRSVTAALEAGAPVVDVLVAEDADAADVIRGLARQRGVPVHLVPPHELARLSDVQTSQGILAVAQTLLYPEADLAALRSVLVLDGVQDPGNVGTILRTAAWFGVEAVLSGPGTADVFNPKVVRAAMGGLWDLHLAVAADLPAALQRLRAAGFQLYGADLEGLPARRWEPASPSALVLGSEAHGLTPAVGDLLDARVALPGRPSLRGTESLNVAVAAGILVYGWLG